MDNKVLLKDLDKIINHSKSILKDYTFELTLGQETDLLLIQIIAEELIKSIQKEMKGNSNV